MAGLILNLKNNVNCVKMRDLTQSAKEKFHTVGLCGIKAILLCQFVPRLFGLVIFSGYDTKCAMFENASIFDCKQEFFVSSPKQWVLCWLVLSILSSICLCSLCSWRRKTREHKIFRNVKFWLMIILFLLTSGSFVIRVINTDASDMALTMALFMWWPATVGLIIYLDNHLPATAPQTNPWSAEAEGYNTIDNQHKNQSQEDDTIWFYIFYHLSLVFNFMECFALALAISLDAAWALLPVAVIHGVIHAKTIIDLAKISLGIRVAFIYCVLELYLQKIVHGDRTLFAKPGEPLQEQPVAQPTHI